MLNRDFVCPERPNLVISIDFDAEGADHCGFGKLACRRISSNPDRCPFTSNLISHFSRVAHNQTPSFWVVNQVDAYFKHIHNLSVKWEEFMKLNPTKKDWCAFDGSSVLLRAAMSLSLCLDCWPAAYLCSDFGVRFLAPHRFPVIV